MLVRAGNQVFKAVFIYRGGSPPLNGDFYKWKISNEVHAQVAVMVEKGFDGLACLYSMQIEMLLPSTRYLVTHLWLTWCRIFYCSSSLVPLDLLDLCCLPFMHI